MTVAEIETEDDLGCLKAEGCNEGQGYLFSAVRPQSEILQLLQAKRAHRAA